MGFVLAFGSLCIIFFMEASGMFVVACFTCFSSCFLWIWWFEVEVLLPRPEAFEADVPRKSGKTAGHAGCSQKMVGWLTSRMNR